jgi:multidrug efflux pump subunit AcrA (membrane-fusion protein)
VPIYSEWVGTLTGIVNAQIRSKVPGYLVSQNYREGAPVKTGDLLFQVDPRTFQNAVDGATAKPAGSPVAGHSGRRRRWPVPVSDRPGPSHGRSRPRRT